MSEKKMPAVPQKSTLHHNLKHFVGFGAETPSRNSNTPASVTGRLKELVRKVEDLNRRVDRLNNNF